MYPTKQRLDAFQMICPLIKSENTGFYKLSSREDIKLNHIDDARSYTTGVVRNGFPYKALKRRGFTENKNFYVSLDNDINIQQLLNGKVDFVIDDANVMAFRLNTLKLPLSTVTLALEMPLSEVTKLELCIATNKHTSEVIVEQLRSALLSVH